MFQKICLALFVLLFSSCDGKSQISTIVSGAIGIRLDSFFIAAEKEGFHGNVSFLQKGEILLQKGYGYANHATNTRFSPETYVQIGSNVKDFTKLSILQLVEEEKLALTDQIVTFIPGLKKDALKITVSHLLNHTSGLPMGFGGDAIPITETEMISSLKELTLESDPGNKQNYSNLGYALLAYIVEKISGKSFDQYVYDHILKPAGMMETGSYLPKFNSAMIAHGYHGSEDIGIILDMPHDKEGHLWSLRGNGGYLSTVSDMHRFYQTLGTDKLLKTARYRNNIYNPANPAFLAGSDMVSFFVFRNLPEQEIQMIIATNHSAYMANKMMPGIDAVLGVPPMNGLGERVITEATTGGEHGSKTHSAMPALSNLPSQGYGLTIQKYFESFNTGDASKMEAYFQQFAETGESAPPITRRVNNFRFMYDKYGKIKFESHNKSKNGGWVVKILTEKEGVQEIVLFIDEETPYRFIAVQIL